MKFGRKGWGGLLLAVGLGAVGACGNDAGTSLELVDTDSYPGVQGGGTSGSEVDVAGTTTMESSALTDPSETGGAVSVGTEEPDVQSGGAVDTGALAGESTEETADPAVTGGTAMTPVMEEEAAAEPMEEAVEEPVMEASATSMTFTVTTEPYAQTGRRSYSPRNIGAIWVESGDGGFVKTLKMWAARRARYLTAFAASANNNTVDAITGATLRNHETHTVTWDLTDASGAAVAPGDYQVRVEGTEVDAAGPNISVPFTLGAPETIDVGDDGHFKGMKIELQ